MGTIVKVKLFEVRVNEVININQVVIKLSMVVVGMSQRKDLLGLGADDDTIPPEYTQGFAAVGSNRGAS